ncbi:MAG: hypothetical protein LBT57_00915 [Puniceicoccales bacterium]|jgi:hypothetical protein|nr:hypothetical protein [Puniceicoccales bacterium]
MLLAEGTFLFGATFLLLGVAWLCFPGRVLSFLGRKLRATWANILCFGLAMGWFLYNISHLGEADFGQYRTFFFGFFAMIGLIALFHIRDFLAVRGVCILILLSAHELLKSAYLELPISRLWMVSGTYVLIVLAIYLGIWPYRFRDLVLWLQEKRGFFYPRLLGALFSLYGCVVLSTLY